MELSLSLDTPEELDAAQLRFLDSSLRCPVCSELFKAPVLLTSCSHTFCSLCLRQAMQLKKTCPQCHAEADESRIRKNHAVAEIVKAWIDARSAILELQQRAARLVASTSKVHARSEQSSGVATRVSGTRAARQGAANSTSNGKRRKREPSSDVEIIEDSPPASKKGKRSAIEDSPPASKKGKRSARGKAAASAAQDLSDPNMEVVCPICSDSFRNLELNMHIDRCNGVKSQTRGKQHWDSLMSHDNTNSKRADKASNTSKPLALVSYSNLKLNTLTGMLNDLGLPLTLPQSVTTQAGKIEIYKTRHQHYVTLHNANADVPADDTGHKTRAELLKDLAKWEKIRNTGQELDAPVIESSKQYLKEHEDEFRDLVRQARASMKAKRDQQHRETELEKQRNTNQLEAEDNGKSDVAVRPEETSSDALDGAGPRTPPRGEINVKQVHEEKRSKTIGRTTKDTAMEDSKMVTGPTAPSSPTVRQVGVRFATPPEPEAGSETDTDMPDLDGRTDQGRLVEVDLSDGPRSPSEMPQIPMTAEEEEIMSQQRRRRTPSPYNPDGPRPSQRVRDAEMQPPVADDEEDV